MEENKKNVQQAEKGFRYLILACVVYLIWWFVNYYPDSPYRNFLKNRVGMIIWGSMFLIVAIMSIAGVILITKSFRKLSVDRSMLKGGKLVAVCICLSVLIPLLISRIRFITLDIFLIIWWMFLELYSVNVFYGSHILEKQTVKKSFIRTIAYALISLFLYIIYPFPSEYVRFVLGMVPIVLYAADMTWLVKKLRKVR